MTSLEQRRLTYHGAITFLLSLSAGAVFMIALIYNWAAEPQRAWGAAHRALIVIAVWQIAVSAVMPNLVLTTRATRFMNNMIIWGAYGIAFGVWSSALSGYRGLAFAGPFINYLSWGINDIGGTMTLVGAVVFFRGAASAMKAVSAPDSK
jgi:hypothetical protein